MKYKLIKEYPNSVEIGTEITKSTNGFWWVNEDKRAVALAKSFNPEDYPEFWEKIEDYVGVTSTGISIERFKSYSVVDKFTSSINTVVFVKSTCNQDTINELETMYSVFKTKGEAETHVQNLKINQLFEKKCLSLNDVASIFKSASRENIFKALDNTSSQGYRLMQIAKETLKKSGYDL